MKIHTNKFIAIVILSALAFTASAAEYKSQKDRLSYAVGVQMGSSLKQQCLEVNAKVVGQAIADVLAGSKLKVSEADMTAAITAYQQEMEAKHKAAATKQKAAGVEFLAKNKKRKGVTTLASGVQYEVLKAGKGAKPKKTDEVVVHYTGSLIDGTVFDSSVKRGQPATFPVTGVIPGWIEILQLMPVGSKWKVAIPSEHAYGERGSGRAIGPHATLIFEMELISIKK